LRAQQHAGPIVGTEASVPSFLFRCTMDASTQSIGCVVETVAGQPPWSASNIRSCQVFAGRSIAAVWVDPRRRGKAKRSETVSVANHLQAELDPSPADSADQTAR